MCTATMDKIADIGSPGQRAFKHGVNDYFRKPEMPGAPPATQDGKDPDTLAARRKQRDNMQRNQMAGGTWLTGVSGVPTQSTNTGATTLLGG